MLTRRRHRHQDDGFTLIELLISISLLGLLMAAVTGAMFVAMGATRDTDTRLSESRDLRLATSYFAPDVAGAQSFETRGAARCGGDPVVVELRGESFDAALATQVTVQTYVLRADTVDGAPSRVLHRLTCSSSSATPSYPLTPTADVPVARLVSTTVDPAVSCRDAGGAAVDCWAPGAVTVDVGLTSRSGELVAHLTGHRRTS